MHKYIGYNERVKIRWSQYFSVYLWKNKRFTLENFKTFHTYNIQYFIIQGTLYTRSKITFVAMRERHSQCQDGALSKNGLRLRIQINFQKKWSNIINVTGKFFSQCM